VPTPIFAFRLPVTEREALIEMSKLCGYPNPRAFLREMVGTMCSGDVERVKQFNARLIRAAGEQLILKLNGPLEKPASTGRKPRKRRRPRDRAT